MKIFNGTPHDIKIIVGSTFQSAIRKYTGGEVTKVFPSNGALNAKIDTVELDPIYGIPTFGKTITGCDTLPEGYDVYIVSVFYATALRTSGANMDKIFIVADPVMSDDGATFIGCRGITQA